MRKSHKLAFLIAAAAILAFPLALAQAASAPTARTASATNVAATSATLRGTVNPNGEQTNYAFDWGTSTSYGQQTPATSAGSGTSAKDVSSALSGLSPGVTYHFRVTATNASGTAVGSDQTFTTHPAPNVATGGATSVSSSSAVVNGVVNPQGHRTTYFFQYGTSPSYGVQTTPGGAGSGTNNVAVHSTLTGLAPGTLYHYRLVAQNSGGTSTGSDATFTTTSSPTQSHVAFMGRMINAVRPHRPDFTFLTGWDVVLVPMMLMGADGGTNATSGITPELMRRTTSLSAGLLGTIGVAPDAAVLTACSRMSKHRPSRTRSSGAAKRSTSSSKRSSFSPRDGRQRVVRSRLRSSSR